MAAPRSLAFVLAGLAITGCSNVLPKPEYTYVKTPPAIRTLPDGTKVDDRGKLSLIPVLDEKDEEKSEA